MSRRIGVHWILWELDASKEGNARDFEIDWGWDGLTGTVSAVW